MRAKQPTLFEYFGDHSSKKRYGRTQYGGAPSKGHRKLERPLSSKHWIHLVLKSDKAIGEYSLLRPKHRRAVDSILRSKARKFGVRIAEQVNMGNHLHLKIRIRTRADFQKFLKAVTCLIARTVTGAKKGKPFGRFWQNLAFTRVLKTRTEELNLNGYLIANQIEAERGFEARLRFLKRFNHWVYADRLKTPS